MRTALFSIHSTTSQARLILSSWAAFMDAPCTRRLISINSVETFNMRANSSLSGSARLAEGEPHSSGASGAQRVPQVVCGIYCKCSTNHRKIPWNWDLNPSKSSLNFPLLLSRPHHLVLSLLFLFFFFDWKRKKFSCLFFILKLNLKKLVAKMNCKLQNNNKSVQRKHPDNVLYLLVI